MPLASLIGNATDDLGLGGTLQQQVAGETEEERRKRIAQMQQMRQLGPSGSLAVTSLLGGGAPRGT